MIKKLAAIVKMRAWIKLGAMMELNDIAKYIKGRSSLNRGTLINVLCELQETIIFFAKQGYPVKLEGIGVFSPKMEKGGKIALQFRVAPELKMRLGTTKDFTGRIVNKENLGKSADQLVEAWNKANPDNPVAA